MSPKVKQVHIGEGLGLGEDAVSGWDVQGPSPRVTSRFSADCPEGAHLPQPGEQLRLEEPCWQQEPGGNGPEKHEHGMFKDQKGKKVSAAETRSQEAGGHSARGHSSCVLVSGS